MNPKQPATPLCRLHERSRGRLRSSAEHTDLRESPMRRRAPEEHENHERWLVSYADFITLLFAFFVVMYATSSVDKIRHSEITKALIELFSHPQANNLIKLEPDGSPISMPAPPAAPPLPETDEAAQKAAEADAAKALQDIAGQIQQALGQEIAQGEVHIRGTEQWLEIELSNALLFPSGEAQPLRPAAALLEKVAHILTAYPNPVRVEGFADDRPIATPKFPSNWELSAARAARVVRMLMQGGVEPARLAAVGYAEFQPLMDNQSSDGRSRNRRVVLLVSRYLDLRHDPVDLNPNGLPGNPPGSHLSSPAMPALADRAGI